MYTTKQLVRISQQILDAVVRMHLNRHADLLQRFTNVRGRLEEIVRTSKDLAIATDRHWMAAAEYGHERMNRDLRVLADHIQELSNRSRAPASDLPTLRLIYEDLVQLQDEFEDFTYDFKTCRLSIRTEPVELEGIYLGPFSIQLNISQLSRHARDSSYRVVAQNPHTACTNEEVTHPHVSSELLCEGDGTAAISAALQQGRLVDFFTLVSRILNTYNPASAYVKLESWYDAGCYECGTEISEDEIYYCQFCRREFCDTCSSYCHSCDTTGCLNCLDRCSVCDERICSTCLKTCKVCKKTVCLNCMEDSNNLICPDCQDQESESEENQNDESHGNDECDCENCRARKQGTCPCQAGGTEEPDVAENAADSTAV